MKLLMVTCLISLFALNITAQNKNVLIHSAKIPDTQKKSTNHNEVINNDKAMSEISNISEGNLMLTTGYDYSYNNSSLRVVDLVDLNWGGIFIPVMVGYGQSVEGENRKVIFSYADDSPVQSLILFDTTLTFNSLSLQFCTGGPFDGKVLVLAASAGMINWAVIELPSMSVSYFSVPFSSQVPSFVYLPDGTIWISSNDLKIYKSTDQGNSFDLITTVGSGDANFGTPTDSPAELPIHSSSDGQYLSIVGAFDGASLTGNPDGVYWYYSTSAGNNWQGEFIGKGSGMNTEYGQITNRDYAPYFTNFAQGNAVVDDMGITHVVYNGYGEGILPGESDTTNVFPVIYWNSNIQQWKAITEEEREAPDDGFGHNIIDYYPGNAIGNAYPSIAVSSNGERVMAFWVGPEDSTIYGGPFNIYPGDSGANSIPVYHTNLYGAASYVRGEDLGPGGPLECTYFDYNSSETFPIAVERIIISVPSWIEYATFIYFEDSVPGVSLFGENDFSIGEWNFCTQAFYFPSVRDEKNIIDFYLEQNYPNPFNPSTKIKFTIPVVETGHAPSVQLIVYDVLGKEVATLINKEMQGGSYEVEFSAKGGSASGGDAYTLASGIYFYKLKVGSFIEIKKMTLLK